MEKRQNVGTKSTFTLRKKNRERKKFGKENKIIF